jgi:hypothetical protein
LARFDALVALAIAFCACRSAEERRWAPCTCDYVTDMDHPGKIEFEVCGEPSFRKDVAKNCALGAGVGAVLECACRASGDVCRDHDVCRDVRH